MMTDPKNRAIGYAISLYEEDARDLAAIGGGSATKGVRTLLQQWRAAGRPIEVQEVEPTQHKGETAAVFKKRRRAG